MVGGELPPVRQVKANDLEPSATNRHSSLPVPREETPAYSGGERAVASARSSRINEKARLLAGLS
jgi:hypothetical protein